MKNKILILKISLKQLKPNLTSSFSNNIHVIQIFIAVAQLLPHSVVIKR